MFSKKCDKIKNTLNRRTKLPARLSTRNKKRAFFGLQELLQAQLNSDRTSVHMCQKREKERYILTNTCVVHEYVMPYTQTEPIEVCLWYKDNNKHVNINILKIYFMIILLIIIIIILLIFLF